MKLSERQLDMLKELINIGVGQGAAILNTMLRSHIRLRVPEVKLLSFEELHSELDSYVKGRLASVSVGFSGKAQGSSALLFPPESIRKLESAMTGKNTDPAEAGAVNEIGNIVLNGVMGTIANMLKVNFRYSVPSYCEGDTGQLLGTGSVCKKTTSLMARTHFSVDELGVSGDILLLFELTSLDDLLAAIDAHLDATESSYG